MPTITRFPIPDTPAHTRARTETETNIDPMPETGAVFAIARDEHIIFQVKVNDVENCRFFFISFVFIYRCILFVHMRGGILKERWRTWHTARAETGAERERR